MRKMTTVSASLSSIPKSVIQIRLLYGYGDGNENRSFFHYGNRKVPSLVPSFSAGAMENWGLITFRETRLLFDKEIDQNTVKQVVQME